MTTGVEEQRKAVQAGYWQLLRFNPALMDEGKNPLQIDSKLPAGELSAFMAGENRFRLTKKLNSAKYDDMVKLADKKRARRDSVLRQLAEKINFEG